MKKRKIVGLDKAKAFWGLADKGRLTMDHLGSPLLFRSEAVANVHFGTDPAMLKTAKRVRVFLLVEDE